MNRQYIDMDKILDDMNPEFKNKKGSALISKLIKALVHQDELNEFINDNSHLRGLAFLDKILKHFDFSYQISDRSLSRIPSEGRLVIVANHPIGTLDGLAILKMVRSVRSDVKIVANELLQNVEPLSSLFISIDNMSPAVSYQKQFKAMLQALDNDEAVIIFPAGEVSRIKPTGIKDGKWKTGFLKLAKRTRSPILPVYIDASQSANSALFYGLSTVFKPLGTLMLVNEMFNKENKEITFHVGKPIQWAAVSSSVRTDKKLAKKFRKHVFNLVKKHKKPLFPTYEAISHPVERKILKKDLYQSELLGETPDGKKIFLYDYRNDSPVMHEVGRLREFTFRAVEEGTGTSIDMDHFDAYYRHLILWDDNDLEIVGAYRIGEGWNIMKEKGIEGFYSNSLFEYSEKMTPYLEQAIELGRSFVQPKYWGMRSLDYLWYGIGAYYKKHPQLRYMFGPVSLSNGYPEAAKDLIISFYDQHFGGLKDLAKAKMPYQISDEMTRKGSNEFSGEYRDAFKNLVSSLNQEGAKVPTLYKQYSEICDDKGCAFIAFNVDPEFNNCIDSLILVDLEKLNPKKKARYLKGDPIQKVKEA